MDPTGGIIGLAAKFIGWIVGKIKGSSAERARLAAFVGVTVQHGGETYHLAWDGPLALIQDQRPDHNITPDLQAAIADEIWDYGLEPLQPELTHAEDVRNADAGCFDRIRSSIAIVAAESGTGCAFPFFEYSPGIVHNRCSRSIQLQRAARVSSLRVAV